jgi:hypothetical protein
MNAQIDRQRESTVAEQRPHPQGHGSGSPWRTRGLRKGLSAVSSIPLALTVFFFFSAHPIDAADCAGTSSGFVPISDLGSGAYQGFEGGLYPGGLNNRPAPHDQALDRTGRVLLLNSQGVPDAAGGKTVLMSVGMSNTTQEFSAFIPLANADPEKNSRLVIVDAAEGGQDANTIANPGALYWTHVDQKLAAASVTAAQVQVVWLKEARANPTESFPTDAALLRDELRSIVQIIKSRYPNTRAVYLSSRTYAGYASTALNPEPYAYQSAFAVKWLIAQQLAGDPALNFDPARGAVMAPWLSWGPYLWADGLTPRSDGLTWACSDFRDTDGTHPSDQGRAKVAGLLLDFFKSDPTTAVWFKDCFPADPGTFAAPPEVLDLRVGDAGGGAASVSWSSLDPVVGQGAVYDLVSGLVSQLRADRSYARAACLASSLADTPFSDARPGPSPGQAAYYLAHGRNSCGVGTYGESGLEPDPRAALDAGVPACP